MGKFSQQRLPGLRSFAIDSNSNLSLDSIGAHSNDNSNDSGFGIDISSDNCSYYICENSNNNTENLCKSTQIKNMLYKKNFPYKDNNKANHQVVLDKSLLLGGDKKPSVQFITRGGKSVFLSKSIPRESMDSIVTSTLNLQNNGITHQVIPLKKAKFSFPSSTSNVGVGATANNVNGGGMKLKIHDQNKPYSKGSAGEKRIQLQGSAPSLATNLSTSSRDGSVSLVILRQPEDQHRARYQTEGSRGAIKDRKGNGFPTVKLVGYNKPATLQIFIGNDAGKSSPHMFYQSCKVTGKSSTPCLEKKVEGTVIIEIEFEPSKDMTISCDCVGILKERNVDVEQRFPFHHASQSRKKSTKCRMIFRCTILNSMGQEETLQIASQSILCTQPPGSIEICKQSTNQSEAKGGLELFIIGKNFLKDTKVILEEEDNQGKVTWEAKAEILKDFLQQNHLICVIPPYKNVDIMEPVKCKMSIWSGGRQSERQRFTYLPNTNLNNNVRNCIGLSESSSLSICSPSSSHSESSSTFQDTLMHNDPILPVIPGLLMSQQEQENSNLGGISNGMNEMKRSPLSDIAGLPAVSVEIAASTFSNGLIATSTHERQVVNELQTLLDQSAQQQQQHQLGQEVVKIENELLPMPLLPPTSFPNFPSGKELSAILASQEQPQQQQQQQSAYQTSPIQTSMNCVSVSDIMRNTFVPITSESVINIDQQQIQQQQNSPTSVVSSVVGTTNSEMNFNDTCVNVMSSIQQQHQNVVENNFSQQIIPPPTTSPQQVSVSVLNMMGQDMTTYTSSGAIENMSLTHMSDNDLINYINPQCFDHAGF